MAHKIPKYNDIFAGSDNGEQRAEYARIVWAEGVADLESRDIADKLRLHTLDRYVRARVEYEFLYPVAMSEGPTKRSEAGGEYANMKWSAIGKLNEQIERLEKNLLISPQSMGDKGNGKSETVVPEGAAKYLGRSTAH